MSIHVFFYLLWLRFVKIWLKLSSLTNMQVSKVNSLTKTTYPVEWFHDDAIKWKHISPYWPFLRGIQRSPVNSPHKGEWRGALMFSWICAWINRWASNGEAGNLRRHCAHYDVMLMWLADFTHVWLPRSCSVCSEASLADPRAWTCFNRNIQVWGLHKSSCYDIPFIGNLRYSRSIPSRTSNMFSTIRVAEFNTIAF